MVGIESLVGDAAKNLAEQAQGIDDPRLKAAAERLAGSISDNARTEMAEAARKAPFSRVPVWAYFLPITYRQQHVLGRIYSFQCTKSKNGGKPGEYRMSLSNGAKELNLGKWGRAELKRDLCTLTKLGFVIKRSNGAARPVTYIVDEAACVAEARRNGWDG